jgi:hypothetical protein
MASDGFELRGVAGLDTLAASPSDDGLGKGVFGCPLGRRYQPQEIFLAPTVSGDHVCERRLALGESAGLVEDDGVDP